jgi:LemA protein
MGLEVPFFCRTAGRDKTMDASLLLWAFMALALFWSIGVYKRVKRLRARSFDAFGPVDQLLREYASLLQQHCGEQGGAELGGVPDWLPNLQKLRVQLEQLELANRQCKAAPLAIRPLSELGRGMDALVVQWEILRKGSGAVAGRTLPEALPGQWDALTLKLQSARSGFNLRVDRYNEAIGQLPARLVMGLMGFAPAGRL